jgi:hypothetical protein
VGIGDGDTVSWGAGVDAGSGGRGTGRALVQDTASAATTSTTVVPVRRVRIIPL